MAKKTKKTAKGVKKAITPRRTTHHHHWSHHDFLIVLGGGFLVIVLVLFTTGLLNFPVAQLAQYRSQKSTEPSQMENQSEELITIKDFSYTSESLDVKVGTTVTWTNEDGTVHSAIADDGSFNTGQLQKGESGSVTFTQPGTYSYHCSQHPNMTGTIVVK